MESDEYKITEYLLKHKEGIRDDIVSRAVYGINDYVDRLWFDHKFVEEIVREVAKALRMNYMQVATIIDYEFIVSLFGMNFFLLQ